MTISEVKEIWTRVTGNPDLDVKYANKAKTWASVWPIAPADISALIRYYDYDGRMVLTTEWLDKNGHLKTGVRVHIPRIAIVEAEKKS